MNDINRVEETWKELGFRVQGSGGWVFVRTDPLPDRTGGGLFLPDSCTTPYGPKFGANTILTGVVLSAGKGFYEKKHFQPMSVQVGERVVFRRLEFAWRWKMEDGTVVGSIHENQLLGGNVEEKIDLFGRDVAVSR